MAESINNIGAFKNLQPPLIHADSNIKSFGGRALVFPENIETWVKAHKYSKLFKAFNESPVFPLFYQDFAGYQVIDWHIVENDGGQIAECGAYDIKTGQLVIGIRILTTTFEEYSFGETAKPSVSPLI